jgi:hypothetical protein
MIFKTPLNMRYSIEVAAFKSVNLYFVFKKNDAKIDISNFCLFQRGKHFPSLFSELGRLLPQ